MGPTAVNSPSASSAVRPGTTSTTACCRAPPDLLFEALRDPPRLPAPDKGDHATYALPAFKSYPEGVEYLLDRPVGGTWTGPGPLSAD
ncbi:hypothetical protein [Streptomyces sp. NPDC055607]